MPIHLSRSYAPAALGLGFPGDGPLSCAHTPEQMSRMRIGESLRVAVRFIVSLSPDLVRSCVPGPPLDAEQASPSAAVSSTFRISFDHALVPEYPCASRFRIDLISGCVDFSPVFTTSVGEGATSTGFKGSGCLGVVASGSMVAAIAWAGALFPELNSRLNRSRSVAVTAFPGLRRMLLRCVMARGRPTSRWTSRSA